MPKKPTNKVYASKKRYDKMKQAMVKDTYGDWADWSPRRDVGVFANERTTYKHNGEVKW